MVNRIVLASTSKFRKLQLEQIKLHFLSEAPNVVETMIEGETAAEMAKRLSYEKANSIKNKYSKSLIIGSDQVVFSQGRILGKPLNIKQAVDTLFFLSNQVLEIYSGICIFNTYTGKIYEHVEIIHIKMRSLDKKMITAYLQKEPDALFCAGAVKSEGLGMILIESMQANDPNAVIGLPMYFLIKILLKENFNLL